MEEVSPSGLVPDSLVAPPPSLILSPLTSGLRISAPAAPPAVIRIIGKNDGPSGERSRACARARPRAPQQFGFRSHGGIFRVRLFGTEEEIKDVLTCADKFVGPRRGASMCQHQNEIY